MMHDNLDPHVEPRVIGSGEQMERRDDAVLDREVPLEAQVPPIIHRWLDGEAVSQDQLQAAEGFAFWRQVNAETDRRRSLRTPTPVSDAIMAAVRAGG